MYTKKHYNKYMKLSATPVQMYIASEQIVF